MTASEIFRKHNFLLLDKIMNNGDYTIESKSITDPNNEIFNQPINNVKNDRNPRKSEIIPRGYKVHS